MVIKSRRNRNFRLNKYNMVELDAFPYSLKRRDLRASIKSGFLLPYFVKWAKEPKEQDRVKVFVFPEDLTDRKRVSHIFIGCQVFEGLDARRLYRWATARVV